MLENLDYHIIDKCNLNCASCNDYCPLVEPGTGEGKSIEQITADLTLLSKLKSEFYRLNIMGGEPTLHPQLSKILRIARRIFPNNVIRLITNGTNYNRFSQWKDALVENNIDVTVSLYPYCKDYEERLQIIKKTLEPEINVEVWSPAITDGFNYATFSNTLGLVSDDDIANCTRRFSCPQLKDGKIYLCPLAAQFNRLKSYFKDKIKFDSDDKEYLDLNGEVTAKDFYEFIYGAKPVICEHCVGAHNHWLGPKRPWMISGKSLDEWVCE